MVSREGFFWIGQSYDFCHHVMTFNNTGLTIRWKFIFFWWQLGKNLLLFEWLTCMIDKDLQATNVYFF